MYPQSMFWAKIRKNVTFLHLKISFFPLLEIASSCTDMFSLWDDRPTNISLIFMPLYRATIVFVNKKINHTWFQLEEEFLNQTFFIRIFV